jgi:GT2 family glycosyltransferase
MKDVSVIILNYNSSEFTLKCVESIITHTSHEIDYEIIVVDNNSTKNEYKKLLALDEIPTVKLVPSKINLGFSGGNTFGFQYSSGKYLFFLNNDCEFNNDNILYLSEFMKNNKSVGLCSGQMYSPDKKMMKSINYLPTLSLKILGNSTMRLFNKEKYPDYKCEYEEPIRVQCLAGASMFFDRKIFCEIGGFDLSYFLYCEEEDLAKALENYGYDVYLIPSAKFTHHLSKSTTLNYKSEREFYISLMYYFRKHNNYINYLFLKKFYFLKLLRKFYKAGKYAHLAFFVLMGAPQKKSLRYEQTAYCE